MKREYADGPGKAASKGDKAWPTSLHNAHFEGRLAKRGGLGLGTMKHL